MVPDSLWQQVELLLPPRPGKTVDTTAAGDRRQGLRHPRYPHLPALARHQRDHPRTPRPASQPSPPRQQRRPPTSFDPTAYRRRNVVERCFNRLKQYRSIATRHDKTATSYQGWLDLTTLLMWL